jgi:hypothetical protein
MVSMIKMVGIQRSKSQRWSNQKLKHQSINGIGWTNFGFSKFNSDEWSDWKLMVSFDNILSRVKFVHEGEELRLHFKPETWIKASLGYLLFVEEQWQSTLSSVSTWLARFSTLGGLNEQLAATQREDAVSFGLIAPKLCQHWTCWLGMMRRSTLVLGCCVKISHGWCRYIGCKPWVFSVPGKDRKVMFH